MLRRTLAAMAVASALCVLGSCLSREAAYSSAHVECVEKASTLAEAHACRDARRAQDVASPRAPNDGGLE